MSRATKGYKIMSIDPMLAPYGSDIDLRMKRYTDIRKLFLQGSKDLSDVANGHLFFGFHRTEGGWIYREWAPAADELHLIGDFNNWDRASHPMKRLDGGIWEIKLSGKDALQHGQHVKVTVTKNGVSLDRIPAYIRRVEFDSEGKCNGQIWEPQMPFHWTDGGFRHRKLHPLYIYEAHIGMAQEEPVIGTYREFIDNVLPRIKAEGYNTIQLMGIQEHPYYASFGYQVTNFFAVSSRYGTPEELKELIDRAHSMGMFVLLDLVHSHSCINTNEGLNLFDGTDGQYFLEGERGYHKAWGSRLFDYSKHEVLHFLLSNIKFFQDEYHFDGFRFDGVTSMIYHDHGLGVSFDSYDKYFTMNTNVDAVTYLMLANELLHSVNPFAISIAEDVSGMPGMCLPIRSGGMGFDYRLAMGIPDFWIATLEKPDEDWDMHRMWYELTTRRPSEASVGYSECHDQALVGDKTIMFRLADKEMYDHMQVGDPSLVIERAIALHKMIRFATLTMACDAYLNFMGNEFGHPEWVDFPREGNGWSHFYARRQWSLAQNPDLQYKYLLYFDERMLNFARKFRLLSKHSISPLLIDQQKKLIAFTKGDMVYVFNFHPTASYEGLRIPLPKEMAGKYSLTFSSDDACFGGRERVNHTAEYFTMEDADSGTGLLLYSPNRTALVFKKVD